ncbi:RpsQ Ribosomal protein S17 [Pyrenophora tritici-repentis]|nr:ribosomal protein s17 [Pyrenophora tritici-repentis]KAF7578816.1 TT-ORF1 multi-domain protein [Pyrenophora tritici-repentis]KAG9389366.1 ribosomal protein s17 [Pyrenophora tritici-repentis]KAI1548672.1 RpsQ Ribosomal protein S17 [Pyrenophora tritici-repentis]KAI1552801.1 RpsQ Ribosomal protein S17 [Pyrenophora tritici-repentis]
MSRAVKVRVAGQEWNKKFRKHFPAPTTYLVRDPNNSLVEGDIVRITSGYRTSTAISHVVTSIVAPFGEPVENRPPVLSQAQIEEQRVKDRLLKDVRSAQRGRQASVQRLAQARKQGLTIPTLEEAMENMRVHTDKEKARLEAHGGQAGQQKTAKERRMEQGKKTKAEGRAEKKAKEARKQTA